MLFKLLDGKYFFTFFNLPLDSDNCFIYIYIYLIFIFEEVIHVYNKIQSYIPHCPIRLLLLSHHKSMSSQVHVFYYYFITHYVIAAYMCMCGELYSEALEIYW